MNRPWGWFLTTGHGSRHPVGQRSLGNTKPAGRLSMGEFLLKDQLHRFGAELSGVTVADHVSLPITDGSNRDCLSKSGYPNESRAFGIGGSDPAGRPNRCSSWREYGSSERDAVLLRILAHGIRGEQRNMLGALRE